MATWRCPRVIRRRAPAINRVQEILDSSRGEGLHQAGLNDLVHLHLAEVGKVAER
jgi:hypothetical protein